ncbi:hypothetical protein DIURU_005084 [Diutina rugosa]|uniref:Uncharacterized protein n=1 Tax=Diutina rugosa TaxID=5481 RepID=A0A642UEN8_DIURU|nr:uncharacterized protein DIURU_005084 [Diutina rugosa]KAA8897653.1 hypothetical protein DIURU_005084 [Diutina rugosa]
MNKSSGGGNNAPGRRDHVKSINDPTIIADDVPDFQYRPPPIRVVKNSPPIGSLQLGGNQAFYDHKPMTPPTPQPAKDVYPYDILQSGTESPRDSSSQTTTATSNQGLVGSKSTMMVNLESRSHRGGLVPKVQGPFRRAMSVSSHSGSAMPRVFARRTAIPIRERLRILSPIEKPFKCQWKGCNDERIWSTKTLFRRHLLYHFRFDKPVLLNQTTRMVEVDWRSGRCDCGFRGPALYFAPHLFETCPLYRHKEQVKVGVAVASHQQDPISPPRRKGL